MVAALAAAQAIKPVAESAFELATGLDVAPLVVVVHSNPSLVQDPHIPALPPSTTFVALLALAFPH